MTGSRCRWPVWPPPAAMASARRIALVTGCAIVALSATACGGAPTGAPSAASVYDGTISARTAQVEVVVHIASPHASTYIVAVGQADLSGSGCALTVFDAGATVHELLAGNDLFVELPAPARATNGGKPWAVVDLRSGGQSGPGVAPGSPLTEVDPVPLLTVLTLRPSSVAVVGEATIAGQAVRAYQLTYPTADLDRPGPDGTRPGGVLGLIVEVASPRLRYFRVEVWLDRHDRVVQLEASTTLKREPLSPSSAQSALANQLPATLTVRLDLRAFGQPMDLDLPVATQVAHMPLSRLQAGLL
jgi:hypothetical protein